MGSVEDTSSTVNRRPSDHSYDYLYLQSIVSNTERAAKSINESLKTIGVFYHLHLQTVCVFYLQQTKHIKDD